MTYICEFYFENESSHFTDSGRAFLVTLQIVLGEDEEPLLPPGEESIPLLPEQSLLDHTAAASDSTILPGEPTAARGGAGSGDVGIKVERMVVGVVLQEAAFVVLILVLRVVM